MNIIEYRPLPIETNDLLRLKAAVGDRDRNLLVELDHTDDGADFISVAVKGRVYGPTKSETILFTAVRRAETETGKPCWLVHHPEGGPMHEFQAIPEVAAFLALGEARLCKRSFMTGWSEPGRIVGGGRPEVKRKGTPPPKAIPGRRGRYLPMLGDRAGEVS